MALHKTLFSFAAFVFTGPLVAEAGETHVALDVVTISAFHDRGEQLSREALEVGLGLEWAQRDTAVYAGIYRRVPFGPEQEAFDDEAALTVGAAWNKQDFSIDISATQLTFPGEEAESSLELAGAFTMHTFFAPSLIGFYDTDMKHWGLELVAGPEWEAGQWTFYALGRAGFVQQDADAADRSYAGLEWGAIRPLSESVEFGVFARSDIADEDTFVSGVQGGNITSLRNSGAAAGLSLTISR